MHHTRPLPPPPRRASFTPREPTHICHIVSTHESRARSSPITPLEGWDRGILAPSSLPRRCDQRRRATHASVPHHTSQHTGHECGTAPFPLALSPESSDSLSLFSSGSESPSVRAGVGNQWAMGGCCAPTSGTAGLRPPDGRALNAPSPQAPPPAKSRDPRDGRGLDAESWLR